MNEFLENFNNDTYQILKITRHNYHLEFFGKFSEKILSLSKKATVYLRFFFQIHDSKSNREMDSVFVAN